MNIIIYIYYGPKFYLSYWTLTPSHNTHAASAYSICCSNAEGGDTTKVGHLEGAGQNPWMKN
jgi:hypothetical protein